MEERVQKLLSSCGMGSRRAMERCILEGRVTVNGRTARLGDRADLARDRVELDGVSVRPPGERHTLMLYKPRGVVTTLSDEKGRRSVADLVADCGCRVWPVGRLDRDSEGLLLLTDDGALTHRLTHPSHEVEKEYETWVTGDLEKGLAILSRPMELDGVMLRVPGTAYLGAGGAGSSRLSITIREGKNRQIRRMCGQAGLRVVRLKRIREGALRLDPALRPGQWRGLTKEELDLLR